jgi:hypothetical protein
MYAVSLDFENLFQIPAYDILLSPEIAILNIPTVISALPTLIAAYQSKTKNYLGIYNSGQFLTTTYNIYQDSTFLLCSFSDKINTGIMATLYYSIINKSYPQISVPTFENENIFQIPANIIPQPLGIIQFALLDAYLTITSLQASQAKQTWS